MEYSYFYFSGSQSNVIQTFAYNMLQQRKTFTPTISSHLCQGTRRFPVMVMKMARVIVETIGLLYVIMTIGEGTHLLNFATSILMCKLWNNLVITLGIRFQVYEVSVSLNKMTQRQHDKWHNDKILVGACGSSACVNRFVPHSII